MATSRRKVTAEELESIPPTPMKVERVATAAQMDILIAKLDRIVDILDASDISKEPEVHVTEVVQHPSELLEPCPFCGTPPLYIVDRTEGISIMCPRCRIRTPGYFDNRPTQTPNAIALARQTWNSRMVSDE